MLFITNPDTINDLRPNFGKINKTKKSRCYIEKYIENTLRTSADSELISHRDKPRGKSRILVG